MTGIMPQFTLEGMLTALTAAGYEVSFTQDHDPAVYVASVSRPADGYEHDACGATLAGALGGALPEGIEAYLAAMTPAALPAPGIEADVRTLSDDMTDVFDRLDGLEEHSKTVRPLVWMLVDLMVDANPDGELARRMRAEREAAAAASQN
jgi:hypothetical protein